MISAADRFDGPADERLGQVHHDLIVGVGLVGLHHGELGVVARAQPFVAVDAADLEDPFHAADQQSLQMQLEGDAQEQVEVERVVMGDERPGGGPAGDRLHGRRFDLEEAFGGHGLAGTRRSGSSGR